jgi:hypothetical protein
VLVIAARSVRDRSRSRAGRGIGYRPGMYLRAVTPDATLPRRFPVGVRVAAKPGAYRPALAAGQHGRVVAHGGGDCLIVRLERGGQVIEADALDLVPVTEPDAAAPRRLTT